jgi:acetyl esterase/lipase
VASTCNVLFAAAILMVFMAGTATAADRTELPLWPKAAPGTGDAPLRENVKDGFITGTYQPRLYVYLPTSPQADGASVVVCPGGGYWGLAFDYEGERVAEHLQSCGIAAFVLKYRVRTSDKDNEFAGRALSDAQRAMRLVRAHAAEWHVDPQRVGMMGFSAGGHLTLLTAAHNDAGDAQAADPVERQSCRPDFIVPVYGSLGDSGDGISDKTPPAFIAHAADDQMVPVGESLKMFDLLYRNNVSAELHVFPTGGHGFGLGKPGTGSEQWPVLLQGWIKRGAYRQPTTRPATVPAKAAG